MGEQLADILQKSAVVDRCVFCSRVETAQDLVAAGPLCVAFFDATPLNPGHILVIPRRHEPDLLALSEGELNAIWSMARELRFQLDQQLQPDGFNVGVNIGEAGGQTVDHAHLHLIPRYLGDVPDPKGGIRCLIPERMNYWEND